MVILIDANVVINYLTSRPDPFLSSSIRIFELCSRKKVEGVIALHTLSIVWYVLRKVPEEERREVISAMLDLVRVAGISHERAVSAIKNIEFTDFEDCLQDECAQEAGADFIVTGNTKDYVKASRTKAVTPDEFLLLLSERSSQIPPS